jgi:hypothetical protein
MDRRPPYDPGIIPERVPPAGFVDYWDWNSLRDSPDSVHTGRLAEGLRSAARNFAPMSKLLLSAIGRLTASPLAKNDALADLAVTGRGSYLRFRAAPPTDETLLTAVMAAMPGTDPTRAAEAVRDTLNRAYTVAWALRGDPAHRRALRDALGWIAVSSEDDPAHAPTNISATEDHMGEITVEVAPGLHHCRASIKVAEPPPSNPLPAGYLRQLPSDGVFNSLVSYAGREAHYDRLILFIHGLGSRLEESEYFKQVVIDKGRERGQRFAVLSIDLPGFGYSSPLDVDALLSSRVRRGAFHGFRLPNGRGSNFPLLGFYRDLIATLNKGNTPAGGLQHIMGGSLGGNLTLWAAEKPMFSALLFRERLRLESVHSFASWSPGSIWESYERSRLTALEGNGTHHDTGKHGAKKRPFERMKLPETEATRRTNFFELMQRGESLSENVGDHLLGAWGYPPTPAGMLTQTEFYSAAYRRVFWMAAYEQLTFSHQEPLAPWVGPHGDGFQWPFKTIRGPLFLASGTNDTGSSGVADIYNQVVFVTDHPDMRDVPGRRLLMKNTGHSISDERPTHLAAEVVDFFLGPWGGWRPMGGTLRPTSTLVVDFNPDPRFERVDVCGIGPTGVPHHNYRETPNGSWSGWTSMGGAVSVDSGLAFGGGLDGRLVLFGMDMSGAPLYNYQASRDGADGWRGWTSMGGTLAVGSGLAVGQNADGRLELFGIGPTGVPHHNIETTPGGPWSGWTAMGSQLSISSGLTVGRNADGRLELFGITPAGTPQHCSQALPNGAPLFGRPSWSPWASLGGTLPPNSTLVVAFDPDPRFTRVDVCGIGPTGTSHHNFRNSPSDHWSGWTSIGGGSDLSVDSGLALARNLDGRLELIGIGPTGVPHSNAQTTRDGDWGGWRQLEGGLFSVTSGLAVGKNVDGRLEVFGIGPDGAPWHNRNSH